MATKNLTQKKITLLWALPGSGKTTYAKETTGEDVGRYGGRSRGSIARIDIDQIQRSGRYNSYSGGSFDSFDSNKPITNSSQLIKAVAEEVEWQLSANNAPEVLLDGLITTNDAASKLLNFIRIKLSSKYELTFNIVWWTPDRKACLWNDLGRRLEKSTTTIENLPFEEPSDALLEEFNISRNKGVTRKKVTRKPAADVWMSLQGIGNEKGLLTSSTWSLGGTYGSCWDDKLGTVYPEPPPASFQEFDDLIEKVAPDIKFMQYKRIYAACVETKTAGEGDYYGGYTSRAWYECDLKKLYEMLRELSLVEDVENV